MNMADGQVGPVQCHAHSIGAGLWACPILHISFQSCLSPPNATLQLDSPFIHSVFIIAHAANHLTCRCSCSCTCTWVPSSPARLQHGSTAARQEPQQHLQPAGAEKQKEADKHPRPAPAPAPAPTPAPAPRSVWSIPPSPKINQTTTLSTATTPSTPTSRRLNCGFQDFRLRFCTQE